jgi:hypothetical protein
MRRLVATTSAFVLGTAFLSGPGMSSAVGADGTRQVPSAGTTSIRASGLGPDVLQQPEIRAQSDPDEAGAVEADRPREEFEHGVFPKRPLEAPKVESSDVAAVNPAVQASIEGLNHRDQRLANGGNQFSVEPPDQALCVGGGFTVESVNSVLRVYDESGSPLTGVQDLNTFFKYPAAIDRTQSPPVVGPNVIDPVCHYDPDNKRFIVAITTLHVLPNGDFSGRNTIDVAVSNSEDPTKDWTVYYVPAQNDGTEGTPNHGCTTDGTTPGPCFQDYPHIGADANGVYISTNEYDLFGPDYNASQIFAFSKAQLAQHPATVAMTLVENLTVAGTPGFTVWPATSPAGEYSTERQGSEFFLSTIAGDGTETGNPTGTARQIGLWALTNTSSLDSAAPALDISSRLIDSATYVFPPLSDQKPGDIPLGECVNDTTMPTPFGPGCWQIFFDKADEPAHDEVESHLDAGDTRMQQTWFVDGVLWGSAGTAVRVGGELKDGIVWFAVSPSIGRSGRVQGRVRRDGYLALEENNLTYPAIAVQPGGGGVIAFSVMGRDFYPSAGYVSIDAKGRTGPIHIVGPGSGPSDGFTSYKAFVGDPPRTRWGDYGAAVTDGQSIWMASEYIAQTCTLAEYFPDPTLAGFGSCKNTRTSLANWSTRITKIRSPAARAGHDD